MCLVKAKGSLRKLHVTSSQHTLSTYLHSNLITARKSIKLLIYSLQLTNYESLTHQCLTRFSSLNFFTMQLLMEQMESE